MHLLPPYTFSTVFLVATGFYLGWLLRKSCKQNNWHWLGNIAAIFFLPFYWLYQHGFVVLVNFLFVFLFFAIPVALVFFLRFIGLIA